jgi:hypothetical protein
VQIPSPAPTPDELRDWLRVAGPTTATGALLWTPGAGDLARGWVSYGGPPLIVQFPAGVEVGFAFDGPRRWALDGPHGPIARSDGRRAVAWQGDDVEVGGPLVVVPDPAELLLPAPPWDDPGGEVAPDELLGRACWRWTAQDEVRWVDELTGCLLAHRTPAGTLALTAFEPGAPVDPALFELGGLADTGEPDGLGAPDEPTPRPGPTAPDVVVPWWPQGTLSYPVGGDPDVPSLLVQLTTADDRAPSVWVGVARPGRRAPVRPGVRSRRWDGEDCSLSLSWTRGLADDDVERIVASVPRRWS